MMTLKYSRLEREIRFTKDYFNNLIIKNPKLLRQFIFSLKAQIEQDTEFLLMFENNKEISISKRTILFENCLSLDIDEKKLNTFLQKDLLINLTDEAKSRYQEIINEINEYISTISYDYKLPLSFDTDISLQTFLKAISITSSRDTSSYLGYLTQEIQKYSVVFKKDFFIFINLKDFLTDEEMSFFFKEMNKMELDFLIVSSHDFNRKLSEEMQISIDDDLFDYYVEPNVQKS